MTCCLQESLVAGFPEATAVCLAGIAAADVKILQGRLVLVHSVFDHVLKERDVRDSVGCDRWAAGREGVCDD